MLNVFISSVQKELTAERRAVKDFLTHDPLMRRLVGEVFLFEDIPAADRRADDVYLAEIDRADIYVAILGNDYGYEDHAGLSPTEREFIRATERGIPRLIFFSGADDQAQHPKMRAQGDVLCQGKGYAPFMTHMPQTVRQRYASVVPHMPQTDALQPRRKGSQRAQPAHHSGVRPVSIESGARKVIRSVNQDHRAAEAENGHQTGKTGRIRIVVNTQKYKRALFRENASQRLVPPTKIVFMVAASRSSALQGRISSCFRTSHLEGRAPRDRLQARCRCRQSLVNEAMAIRWARQRKSEFADTPPDQANPCTTVSELVERLNGFKRQGHS